MDRIELVVLVAAIIRLGDVLEAAHDCRDAPEWSDENIENYVEDGERLIDAAVKRFARS